MMDAKMRRALALGALLFKVSRGAVSHALLACSLTAGSAAALEAKMYAVTTWNAGCSGGQRDSWDNMVQDWYDDITNAGTDIWGWCVSGHCGDAYSKEGKLVNGNVVNSRFADLSKVSFGNDHNRMDAGDAVMIGLHGADVSSHWQGSMRVNEAGDGNCSVHGTEMEIGDTDLEFLHLSSCQSMEDNQWSNWEKSMAGAHQVDGFHGLMWIGPGLVNDYGDFSDDAFGGSISDSWIDNMYYSNEFNDGADDQCPVAYAVGSNGADASNRLHNERYDLVFSDPPDSGPTGSGTIWTATYITGCNPAAEDTINN